MVVFNLFCSKISVFIYTRAFGAGVPQFLADQLTFFQSGGQSYPPCYYMLGFPLSRDFSNFQVPGTFRVSKSCPARTTGPSRSLGPVLPGPRDLGPLVPGVPGVLAGPSIFFFACIAFFLYLFGCCITKAKKRRRENRPSKYTCIKITTT